MIFEIKKNQMDEWTWYPGLDPGTEKGCLWENWENLNKPIV